MILTIFFFLGEYIFPSKFYKSTTILRQLFKTILFEMIEFDKKDFNATKLLKIGQNITKIQIYLYKSALN